MICGLLMMFAFLEYPVFVGGGRWNHSGETDSKSFGFGQYDHLYILDHQYDNAEFYGRASREPEVGDAPYVAAMVGQDRYDDTVRAWCTGTIITEQWVVTAAHCSRLFLEKETFQVFAGCSSLIDLNPVYISSSRQIRKPVDGLMHPKYQYWPSPGFVYDIGLIKVDRGFVFGPSVNKIGLWMDKWADSLAWNSTHDSYETIQCTAYGWGVHEIDVPRGPLKMVNISVRHGPGGCTCFSKEMDRLQLCTAPQTDHSLCPDDSGGPLVCNGLLAGIARGGNTCPFKYMFEKANHLEDDFKRGLSDPKSCGVDKFINQWTYVPPMIGWIKHHELPHPMSSARGLSFTSSYIMALAVLFLTTA